MGSFGQHIQGSAIVLSYATQILGYCPHIGYDIILNAAPFTLTLSFNSI
jgi:hypothetical protein